MSTAGQYYTVLCIFPQKAKIADTYRESSIYTFLIALACWKFDFFFLGGEI